MTRLLKLGAQAVLIVMVLGYAVSVIHDFSRYADHYPYLSVDDGLANVSYSLATQGRYGFMASPIQGFSGTPRHEAFYNYGPWYFYAGAALTALFGYSLPLLRSLHLAGILAIAGAGLWTFGRRGSVAAGALLAAGVLEAFERAHSPGFRPDIAVSVFAVTFIIAAGIAMERRSALAWFIACTAAGCAAFSHLIAWALVPCAAVLLAVSIVSDRPDRARTARFIIAAAVGFAAATLMFYGSFGFRVRDHLAYLAAYRKFLDDVPSSGDGAGYVGVLRTYLHFAFDYLSPAKRWLLGTSTVALGMLIAWFFTRTKDARRETLSRLLPPFAMLISYALSLGTYGNYHAGYLILLHVASWWCVAAAVAFLLSRTGRLSTALGNVAELAVAVVLIVALAARLSAHPASERMERVGEWVGISEYTNHVRQVIPTGATVWGSIIFGIDSPDRVQLIQLGEGIAAAERARQGAPAAPSQMAPQYLIWSFAERRDEVLSSLAPAAQRAEPAFGSLERNFPQAAYRLVSLTAAPPYGVARVYSASSLPAAESPRVDDFDPASGLWESRLEGPIDVPIRAVPAVPFVLGSSRPEATADRSVSLTLETGRYVFRVRVRRSIKATRRMVTATSVPVYRDAVADLGPAADFAPYFSSDTEAYLVDDHAGGSLYISQFDDGAGAGIDGVDVFRVARESDVERARGLTFWDMPPLQRWVPYAPAAAGVHAKLVDQALEVEGNATRDGYQLQAPPIPVPAGAHVTVHTDFAGSSGAVCAGALNGAGKAWLRRDATPARDIRFDVDETASFRLTFYNCNGSDGPNPPSRFSLAHPRFAVESQPAVDRWMALAAGANVAPPQPPDFRVRAVPPGLTLSAADLERRPTVVTEADLVFQAPIARRTGETWKISGTAAGGFVYALVLKPKLLFGGQRLFARGRVEKGGLTLGLQQKGDWVGQVDITTPGEFIVAIEAPKVGRYTTVLAYYITDPSLQSDVTISHLGFVGR